MPIKVVIIGRPNVGKSTLFNAITNQKILAENYPFATIEPNVGVVTVPDERMDKLKEKYNPDRFIPTAYEFTDIAGLVKGASLGEGLGNQFLSHIRDCDAICEVVRCFDNSDIIHVNGVIDPINDIETINLELAYADLDVIEKRMAKIERKAFMKVDKESVVEFELLTKCKKTLEDGNLIRNLDLSKEQKEMLRGYNFLTIKPMIYVMNVSEDDINQDNDYVIKVREYAKNHNTQAIKICAKIEEELSDLDEEDKAMFLDDFGIKETGLEKLTFAAYEALGLQTFFTAGEKECRAWTFKKGMKAPECAGIIHSDFEKGFIRAEVTSYDDFLKYGSMQKAKEAGKMRSEGKEYVFQDGDITLFRFNV